MAFPRHEIVKFAQKLASYGLVSGSEGNISLKTREGIFITPSGKLMEDLEPKDIVLLDHEGHPLEKGKPSSEWRLHTLVYQKRQDVKAIIHAHPPYTLALNLADHDFRQPYVAEAALFLQNIQTVPFASPGTEELAQRLASAAQEGQIFILERHGAVTLGRDLKEAFNLMCLLEKVSQITWLALALRPEIKPLDLPLSP